MARAPRYMKKPILERIWERSIPEPNTGCLLWLGSASKGYGYICHKGKSRLVTRIVYAELFCDPGDKDVCHRCDTTYCIEPSHLFLGEAKDNVHDAIKKGRMWQKLAPRTPRVCARRRRIAAIDR